MTTIVPAEGVILERLLDLDHQQWGRGLSRHAYGQLDRAEMRTAWGRRGRHRVALVSDGATLLAGATRSCFSAVVDQRPVRAWAISDVVADPVHAADDHARVLIERLVGEARDAGAEVALLFSDQDTPGRDIEDFEPIPITEVTLGVAQSERHGAPMTLIRGGEARDFQAIVAMGRAHAASLRFHLDRDGDLVEYAITRKRLLAGLASDGARQLQFFIAEEGITAAAYVVITAAAGVWTIEECGDRDPSGARLGAILQALIAREPAERRPTIRGWLPPRLVPPQVSIVSARPARERIAIRRLDSAAPKLALSGDDVLCWHGDIS